MIVIEDAFHAEQTGDFASFDEAVAELARRASIPWDQPPNLPPCTSWRTCGREYHVTEFDSTVSPWKQLRTIHVLDVRAGSARWIPGHQEAWAAAGKRFQ